MFVGVLGIMVDVELVVRDLLDCYERKAILWRKMALIDEEIRVLRASVSEQTLKERGI